MAMTTFHEATATTFAGYETKFTLREVEILAAVLGGVIIEAQSGVCGGTWCGNGWQQTMRIDVVNGKLRMPSAYANRTHALIRLVWNPDKGWLGAILQYADDKGRLLDGHRKLQRDDDGQTCRGVLPRDTEWVANEWADRIA